MPAIFCALVLLALPAGAEPSESVAVFAEPAVRGWMSDAYADAEAGRFDEAREKIAKARIFDGADPELKGRYERAGALAAAAAGWEGAAGRYGQLLKKGALAYFYGRDGEAEADLKEASALDSSDGRADLLLALARRGAFAGNPWPGERMQRALAEGDLDGALRLAEEALRGNPRDILAHLCRALARYRRGDVKGAVDALDAAASCEKSEEARRALRLKAKALERQARPAQASVDPELDRIYDQGLRAYARGRLEEAEAAFRSLLERAPGDERAARALRRVRSERAAP